MTPHDFLFLFEVTCTRYAFQEERVTSILMSLPNFDNPIFVLLHDASFMERNILAKNKKKMSGIGTVHVTNSAWPISPLALFD